MVFKVPLKIIQGASFEKKTTWKAGANRTPVDLTGCTALAHIRANIKAADVLLTLSTENGRIALGGTDGTITQTVPLQAVFAKVLGKATATKIFRGLVGINGYWE